MAAIPFRPEGRCERATADNPNGFHPTGLTASRRKGRRRTPAGFRWSGNRDPLRAVPRIGTAADGAALVDRVSDRQACHSSPRRTHGRRHTAPDYRRKAVDRRRTSADCRSLVVAVGQAGHCRADMLARGLHCTGSSSRAEQVSGTGTVGASNPPRVWSLTLTLHGKAPQPGSRKCSPRLASLLLRRATQAKDWQDVMERVTGIEPA